MAGGWGAPIQAAMAMPTPRNYKSPNNPGAPVLEQVASLKAVNADRPVNVALPRIGSEFSMAGGKAQEAAEYAFAMGKAFGISKIQKRQSSARARALSKAIERKTRREGKDIAKRGRRAGRYERQSDYRTALNEARIRGIGPELFKKARL